MKYRNYGLNCRKLMQNRNPMKKELTKKEKLKIGLGMRAMKYRNYGLNCRKLMQNRNQMKVGKKDEYKTKHTIKNIFL